MTTKIEQPPMLLAEQEKVYEGVTVVSEALALSYEDRGGVAPERAVILRLMEAGWTPPAGERLKAIEVAAERVVANAYGTKARHTTAPSGGCRDDCIPCGIEALREAGGWDQWR